MKTPSPAAAVVDWPAAKRLYDKVLDTFYGKRDITRAAPHALRLLRALDRLDPAARTLPGNEYRAVIAEVDGDIEGAIRHRLREIRMFDRLIKAGRLSTARLGMDEYADRLDLLAALYLDAGQLDLAEKTIRRSEAVCRGAGIPFDGKDIKADIERAKASD